MKTKTVPLVSFSKPKAMVHDEIQGLNKKGRKEISHLRLRLDRIVGSEAAIHWRGGHQLAGNKKRL